ncbi:MAG: glycosyltransferase family 2 protein, partial [Lachnospiraceae bacterium]|nr:glycosyltransferase family 2 protein [Lachnospiraceae bacterium]
ISVIVPVYNGQDYLEDCIDSIEKQTYENTEIIIINDGSTDDTASVCVRLRETYDNLHVITTEDGGVSSARNAGIDAANGVFLTFVDADDRLRPKTLRVLYDCIMRTGSDVAGCGFFSWGKEEEWEAFLREKCRIGRPVEYTPSQFLKEQLLRGNSRCWSKLYRRSAIGELRFPQELSIGEDMLFLVRLLPFLRKIAETDYPGYGYFQNPEGAMNREFSSKYMDQITCWELAREEALKLDPTVGIRAASLVITGIMLTAGKLAMLTFFERRKQKEYIMLCHEKLKEEMQVPGAYKELPKGYQLKAQMFLAMPGIYLALYHLRKYR